MTISTLPTPPSRMDDPAGFSNKADNLLGALPAFVSETNAVSVQVSLDAAAVAANAIAVENSAATAIGSANYKGAWSSLSGSLNIPASVSHAGKLWILVSSVADVTTQTPGISANWFDISPKEPLPFSNLTSLAQVQAVALCF